MRGAHQWKFFNLVISTYIALVTRTRAKIEATPLPQTMNLCTLIFCKARVSDTLCLVQWKGVGIEIVLSRVNGRLVILAFEESAIVAPVRSQWPRTDLRILALVNTLDVGGIQGGWYDSVFNPIDHDREIGLWERTVWLRGMGTAMSSSRDEEEVIPVPECGSAVIVRHVRVHNAAN